MDSKIFEMYQKNMIQAKNEKQDEINNKKDILQETIIEMYQKNMIQAKNEKQDEINSKQDILQETIIALLFNEQDEQKKMNPVHSWNREKKRQRTNLYKKYSGRSIHNRDEKLDMFFTDIENLTESAIYDQSEKRSFNDTVEHIKQHISKDQFELFEMFFLQDMTIRKIAESIGLNKETVSLKINKLINRIHKLKINELYDHKFLTTGGTCKGKWKETILETPNFWENKDKKGFIPAKRKRFNPAGFSKPEIIKTENHCLDSGERKTFDQFKGEKMKRSLKDQSKNRILFSVKQYAILNESINQAKKYPSLKCYDKEIEIQSYGLFRLYQDEGFI